MYVGLYVSLLAFIGQRKQIVYQTDTTYITIIVY